MSNDRSSASLYVLRKDVPKALEVFGEGYYNISGDDDPRQYVTVEYEAAVDGGEEECQALVDEGVMFILHSDACVGAYGEFIDVGFQGKRVTIPAHDGKPVAIIHDETNGVYPHKVEEAKVFFQVWRHLIRGTEPKKAGKPPR